MIRKGNKIGPYTLLEKLGRGGFGVVWLAEKKSALAVTRVALKMPNDDDIDLDAVRREAGLWIQASGHPNVLSFIDADIYDEQVVIVSEYAPDGSLETLLKKNGGKVPAIAEAVEMASGILAGLEHLHSKRIIHRDLKPANILLQGKTPRLVDFGLARVMKSTSHSRTVSGTYSYMPPETFEGGRSEQTDIWSAGVILYEMLVGRLPYPQDTDAALIGAILHGKPEPLPDNLSKPLRAVVERAMEKDLSNRFKTAVEMRTALSDAAFALQTGESKQAKTEVLPLIVDEDLSSEKTTEQFSNVDSPYKTKRMEMPVTDPSPSFDESLEIEERNTFGLKQTEVSPTINAQAVTWQEGQGKRIDEVSKSISKENIRPVADTIVSREGIPSIPKDKVESETESRKGLWIGVCAIGLVLFLGLTAFVISRFIGGDSKTDESQKSETATSKDEKKAEPQKPINPTGRELGVLQAKSNVYEVAISANGKLAASVGEDTFVRLWRNEESKTPVTLTGHINTVRSVAISPDGQTIASGSDDKTVGLWNANDGKIIRFLSGHSNNVFRVSFSEDGQTIVSASSDKTIRFWNVSDGQLKQTFSMPDKSELIVNISPNLRLVAFYLPKTKRVRVWSLANKLVSELQGDKFEVHGGAFSPDSNTIALGSKDGAIRLYRVSDGVRTNVLQGVKEETGRVIYNSGGELIAAGYNDGSICLWNSIDGRLLKTLKGHTKFVFALAFSADNRVLASGGEDQMLRLWEIESK